MIREQKLTVTLSEKICIGKRIELKNTQSLPVHVCSGDRQNRSVLDLFSERNWLVMMAGALTVDTVEIDCSTFEAQLQSCPQKSTRLLIHQIA
jgi:hypothetical protein